MYSILNFSGVPNLRHISVFTHRNPPFWFEAVSVAFVRAQLRRLKVGKAVGLDNIPARLLKDTAEAVAKPLKIIINASLQSGRVPDDSMAARVIPLFKKGKAEDMDNYRPISILPVLSKIFEGAVHRQLYHHLRQHNILSPYHCGFRNCHSNEFAALSFTDTIHRGIDQGQLTGAVFIDLRKAFDTVDHGLLLDKLATVGVSGPEHEWFTGYLRNQTQVVEFHGVTSNPEGVSIGVPQGFILGPLLFILHDVNDLPEAVSECSILMYADDTVLFYSSSLVSTIEMKLNEELHKIERWHFRNSLFINVKMTEAMLFGTAPRLAREKSFNICIDGKQIERVDEFTHLGVVFGERLSWGSHVRKVISKAGKRVGMLGRLRDNLTTHSANVVYISLIRPILEYCHTVILCCCCGEGNSQALEALQKRAGRIVAKTSRSSPAMDILKRPALGERRREHVFQLVKKCIEGRRSQYFDGYFTFNSKIHSRATKQRFLLHLPAVKTEVAKRSFYYYGCVVFNDISLCLKN